MKTLRKRLGFSVPLCPHRKWGTRVVLGPPGKGYLGFKCLHYFSPCGENFPSFPRAVPISKLCRVCSESWMVNQLSPLCYLGNWSCVAHGLAQSSQCYDKVVLNICFLRGVEESEILLKVGQTYTILLSLLGKKMVCWSTFLPSRIQSALRVLSFF